MSAADAASTKDRFTALDTLAVVREIRSAGRLFVDKVFDAGPDTWELTLRGTAKAKWVLILAAGRFAALRKEGGPRAETLGHLARELRRHLGDTALTGVAEPRGERLLELEAGRGDSGRLRLIVEFFGQGNLVLVRDDRILAVAHARSWAHRSVRPGADYVPPPQRGNPWAMSVAELDGALSRSRTDRVRTLAAQLGFGGPVAEEILHRTAIPGHEPASQGPSQVAAQLHVALQELLAEIGDAPQGYLYRRGEVFTDVEPFPSQKWTEEPGISEQRFARFSDAVFVYFSSVAPPAAPTRADPLAELRRQASRQQSAIADMTREADLLRTQADAIFSHHDLAVQAAGPAGSEGSDRTVEADLGGTRVPLVRGRPPRESAQLLFVEIKRLQSKIGGAEAALAATQLKLGSSMPAEGKATPEGTEPAPSRSKVRWFEKFRWFLSSEGVLVIGGRDAASNDLVVRRYLREKDVYIHADVHGAASVIVKHSPTSTEAPGPISLAEAGQWAVAYSKAWRAGHGSADAFWVTPEQVSKRPATGEFVARGSWVIHGTKHWLKDRPLELGLGQIEYEGDSFWITAPPEALRVRGRLRLILTPGDERERSAREVEIVRELGLSRDLLQRLAPAGGLSIRRV